VKKGIYADSVSLKVNRSYYQSNSWRDEFVRYFQVRNSEKEPLNESVDLLSDVSLTVSAGERIGIIGANGTGKTTLCRCIAGIYKPTSGTLRTIGNIRAVFDTAVGMQPELTGRENAELLADLLFSGDPNKRDLLEEALDFSELGRHLFLPYKDYSSGMKARLSLSVASSKCADILILDEVFDGADKDFSEKISSRIVNIINKSGIVIFVSHSQSNIEAVCNRVIQLEGGRLIYDGTVSDGLAKYFNSFSNASVARRKIKTVNNTLNYESLSEEISKISAEKRDVITELEVERKRNTELIKKLDLSQARAEFLEKEVESLSKEINNRDVGTLYEHLNYMQKRVLKFDGKKNNSFVRSIKRPIEAEVITSTVRRISCKEGHNERKRQDNKSWIQIDSINRNLVLIDHSICNCCFENRLTEKFTHRFITQCVFDKFELGIEYNEQSLIFSEMGLSITGDSLTLIDSYLHEKLAGYSQSVLRQTINSKYVFLNSIPWQIGSEGVIGQMVLLIGDGSRHLSFDPSRSNRFYIELLLDSNAIIICDRYQGYSDFINEYGRIQFCWDELEQETDRIYRSSPSEMSEVRALIQKIKLMYLQNPYDPEIGEEEEKLLKALREILEQQLPSSLEYKYASDFIQNRDKYLFFIKNRGVPISNSVSVEAVREICLSSKKLVTSSTLVEAYALTFFYCAYELALIKWNDPKENLLLLLS